MRSKNDTKMDHIGNDIQTATATTTAAATTMRKMMLMIMPAMHITLMNMQSEIGRRRCDLVSADITRQATNRQSNRRQYIVTTFEPDNATRSVREVALPMMVPPFVMDLQMTCQTELA
jgi:hypothetical protein